MLDISYIVENLEEMKEVCRRRRVKVDLDALVALDEKRRALETALGEARSKRNAGSKQKPSPEEIEKMRALGQEIARIEGELETVMVSYKDMLLLVPNKLHPESPDGGEDDYRVIFEKKSPGFSFQPKDHEELFLQKDLIDFERAAKVSGAKFYYLKDDLVLLNQALIRYATEVAMKRGFRLLETPDIAKQSVIVGAGFNPRGDETQIYNLENTDQSLIGTAEITVLGYHADEVLDLSAGPKKYLALSHCFRTEAGAYGRTSKGLYRVHQFTKLEMFIFSRPEDSEALHEELLSIEQEIADGLGFPYRVIDIAAADLGAPAYRKFDIEAFMVMKGSGDKVGDYGEITSTSNCLDFQARRMNIRHRRADGKLEYVHTLNGTAAVTSRLPIALAENFQQADGSIVVPEVLRQFFGKDKF